MHTLNGILLGFFIAIVGACSTSANDAEDWGSVTQAETLSCPTIYSTTANSVVYDKEIVINDPLVVDDLCRTTWNSTDPTCTSSTKNKWHFWYLMQQMAGTQDVTRFILRWLDSYFAWIPAVNAQNLQTRIKVRSVIINAWMVATNTIKGNSNCVIDTSIDDARNVNCQLDPSSTPLRLLAIVNRTDLRSNGAVSGTYGGGDAGEGRFVFGFTKLGTNDPDSIPPNSNKPLPVQAVVILEYRLPTPSGWNPQQWAQKWHALGATGAAFNEPYKMALQALTDKWTAQFNVPSGPNRGTSISQVRMNDFAFDSGHFDPVQNKNIFVWSLREFKLGCPEGKTCTTDTQWLIPSTVTQTPSNSPVNQKNNSQDLEDFIKANSGTILSEADNYQVPATFNNSPFLGAESTSTSKNSAFGPIVWTYPGYDPLTNPDDFDLRRRMAFVTCNGCHYAETQTNNLHISNRSYGTPANLSDFLKQPITVTDLDTGNTIKYNEPARRKCELAALIGASQNKVSTTSGRPH